jgi:hypothetical protein
MGDEYIVALLAAALVGVLYAILINFVNHFFEHVVRGLIWLEVVIGVGMTLGICLICMPAATVLQIFFVFAITGGLMSAGCIVRDRWMIYQGRKIMLARLGERLGEPRGEVAQGKE